MANIYSSNAIRINKRPNHIPLPVAVHYHSEHKLNQFSVQRNQLQRVVAETYQATDRNHKIPVTDSPLMMCVPTHQELRSDTINKIDKFHNATQYKLMN